MHPVLFRFQVLTLYTYGAMVALAVLASLVAAEVRAKRFGLEKSQAADVLFMLFLFGVLGARVFYVVQHWDAFAADPWSAFRLQEGGLVWYGGLICAAAGGIGYARWRGWPVLRLADFFAPISAMAHGIGRIGCFLNGCCYGRELPSGGHFPAQLLEAAGLFAVSAFLFAYARRNPALGRVLGAYLGLYGLLRFGVEFTRGDNAHHFYLTLPQWISLGFITAGFYLWKARR